VALPGGGRGGAARGLAGGRPPGDTAARHLSLPLYDHASRQMVNFRDGLRRARVHPVPG
jgi:hypothetical protein